MAQLLSALPIGAKVKDVNTKYLGTPVTWLIAANNHKGDSGFTNYPSNSVTLLAEKIITNKALDAREPNNSNSEKSNFGNNGYFGASLDVWLNADVADWYIGAHQSDSPPSANNVFGDPYENESGFLTNFSTSFKTAILETDLRTTTNKIDGGGTSYIRKRKVFLLSAKEVRNENENSIAEGARLAIFAESTNQYLAYPTQAAVNQSSETGLSSDAPIEWWLRTPNTSNAYQTRTMTTSGTKGAARCYEPNGVRPALNLIGDVLVSDTPDADGAYVMQFNAAPTLSVTAPVDARTLYENDVQSIAGSVTDTDVGNIVSVKFSINGGTTRAISANVSAGTAIAFAKNLTYKSGKLYDGTTAITDTLAEGSQHTIKIWAEDDQGGKSNEITRSFYVVANRAATLTLDAFVTRAGLINTDVINISGKVADLDNGNVIVKYKIGNGAYTQVFNKTVGATPTAFNFNIALSQLTDGENTITLQAVDAFGAITQHVLKLKKEKVEEPLKTAVTYYQIMPPNGTADGLQLFIERELGDLAVAVDIFMGASGIAETFVPMTLASTANLANGNVEDTFSYQHSSEVSKIVVRITMTRTGTATNKAIKKISGVLT